MTPEQFVRSLHADSYEPVSPLEQVDWSDAPLAYKLYRGLPVIPLCAEVPLSESGGIRSGSELDAIGYMLWYAYGISRVDQYRSNAVEGLAYEPMQSYRRFVPSGGGLYPNELYIYLRTTEAPAGIYHYDAAHHRLSLLREGLFDSCISQALGNRCDVSQCTGVVLVSVMFWKNVFKYHEFAYRLQGLDTGVLIGQLLESTRRFGFETGVCLQFLDRALHHLLGLDEQEESVYAVIPFSTRPAASWFQRTVAGEGNADAAELSRELPAVRHEHYVRSQNIKPYPLLARMNEAAMHASTAAFRCAGALRHRDPGAQAVYLPFGGRRPRDFFAYCRMRQSPEADFVLRLVPLQDLAALLQETVGSAQVRTDLTPPDGPAAPRLSLYCTVYHVEGVADGAYRYDAAAHMLRRVRAGDHRTRLQAGMTMDNVNLYQVPLCFHVAGERDYGMRELGPRGYRIQQMEAGMLVHRLLLAASDAGMGGRPLLGYAPSVIDELYRLGDQGTTALIQIPVGPYRGRPRLEGSLRG